MILFKSQLLRKWFYFINIAGLIYRRKTYNCIYIYNQIGVYSVNGRYNLPIHLKKIDSNKYLLDIIDFK